MPNILRTLKETETIILPILAHVWGVDVETLDHNEIIDALNKAMQNPEQANRVWDTLKDDERGALQALIGTGGRMSRTMFDQLFGKIRPTSAAILERDAPHQNPISKAEALYYKGLIAQGFEKSKTGAHAIIYVPDDLLAVLPVHRTAYENLEDITEDYGDDDEFIDEDGSDDFQLGVLNPSDLVDVRAADTSIVDDVTTLLAYIQLETPTLHADPDMGNLGNVELTQEAADVLLPFMLQPNPERLTFVLGVAISAGLVEIHNGKAFTNRQEVRRWLAASRAEQVRALTEGWYSSQVYHELWHVPGLHPEPGGTIDSYNPAVVRQAIYEFFDELIPRHEWWSVDGFIGLVKETEPDFQRPGGVYDSWYIRNDAGDYLEGFESWDAVEGALLDFIISSPMHWLGLMDIAEDSARLSAYGRAFLDQQWITPADPVDKITVKDDGTLHVSRKISRIDRFQIARFTSWISAGDPYVYRLDAKGINRALAQGISTAHIRGYISKALNDAPLPAGIAKLLDNWGSGAAATVTIERPYVMRTQNKETLDRLWDAPNFRRYFGARLGDTAVIVRGDQIEGLRAALGSEGVQVDMN